MDRTPRRRRGRLAALLPALLVVAVLGTGGGSLTAGASSRVVDLQVTTPGSPASR